VFDPFAGVGTNDIKRCRMARSVNVLSTYPVLAKISVRNHSKKDRMTVHHRVPSGGFPCPLGSRLWIAWVTLPVFRGKSA
jgi:hypothetical protein